MRKFLWILLLVPLPLLSGCSLTAKIGNWSIWSATATNVTVVNNTENLYFDLILNGKKVRPDLIPPGSHGTFGLRNFTDQHKGYGLVIKAYDGSGNVVGVTTEEFTLGSYQASNHTLVLDSTDFSKRR